MFWSGMVNLNVDEPQVSREIYDIGKFWLSKGVDGFRMDAAKHICPDDEVHKTHAFWEEFRSEMETVKPDEGIREAFLWDIRKNDRDRTNWRKPKYNTDSRVTPLN
jgi:glycosidase